MTRAVSEGDFTGTLKIRDERTIALVIDCSCGTMLVDVETEGDWNLEKVRAKPEGMAELMESLLTLCVAEAGISATVCDGCGRYVQLAPGRNN